MGKEVRVFMLAITASIFLNWVAPATVFADEPISVGPRVQPPNPQQFQAQSQPEQLRSDPSSALGSRLIQLPALGQASVKSQMAQDPGGPTKIGFGREVDALRTQQDTQTQLDWKPVPDGMVGSLAISSPGAAALRMGIRIQSLPETAELRFFSDRATEIQKISGKTINDLINLNLTAGDPAETARVYWSPVINGEIVGLEVFLPQGTSPDQVEISLPSVSHIEISPLSDLVKTQDFGDSGACNLDVMCNPSWQSTSNSVARMLYTKSGQSYWCTGTLLNDVGGTYTPYFLSANHCISTQSAASSLETYWFYHSTACNSGVLNPSYQTLSQGASLLFNAATTDASFMKLNGTVPAGVVFSGWTTQTPAIGTNLTGVHDPRGDMQMISYGSVTGYQVCTDSGNSSFSCTPSNASSGTFLQVVFGQGITEGGSSGSGIFPDSTQQLTGQLCCGNTSCANPTSPTFYGRFDKTYALGNLGQWLAASSSYTASVSPDTYNFGEINVGETRAQTFTFTNTGTGNLTLASSSPQVLGEGYSASNTTCTSELNIGSSCTVSALFNPTKSGVTTGRVSIGFNETTSPVYSRLTGTGVGTPIYSVAVGKSGNGTITSIPAGINCGSTCSASFNSGTSVTLSATPDTNYVFSGWSGDCSGTGACVVTLNSNKNVSATFTYSPPAPTSFNLAVTKTGSGTVSSQPSGIDCGSTCSGSFSSGATITLVALPENGFEFSGWSGACSGAGNCSVLMDGDKAVSANFVEVPTYAVTVTKQSGGVVSSDPAGILCGGADKQCKARFSTAKLTATPNAGYEFIKWTGCQSSEGNICYIDASGKMSLKAVFKKLPKFTVRITKNKLGSITSLPEGLKCQDKKTKCSTSFVKGTAVTLTPVPQEGRTFAGWTGACSGFDPCAFTLDGNKGVGATFQ